MLQARVFKWCFGLARRNPSSRSLYHCRVYATKGILLKYDEFYAGTSGVKQFTPQPQVEHWYGPVGEGLSAKLQQELMRWEDWGWIKTYDIAIFWGTTLAIYHLILGISSGIVMNIFRTKRYDIDA